MAIKKNSVHKDVEKLESYNFCQQVCKVPTSCGKQLTDPPLQKKKKELPYDPPVLLGICPKELKSRD